MRIDIDAGVEHGAALIRANGRKQVGRKHNHQPRGRARDKRLAAQKRSAAMRLERIRQFNAKVRAYWTGQSDVYPA